MKLAVSHTLTIDSQLQFSIDGVDRTRQQPVQLVVSLQDMRRRLHQVAWLGRSWQQSAGHVQIDNSVQMLARRLVE